MIENLIGLLETFSVRQAVNVLFNSHRSINKPKSLRNLMCIHRNALTWVQWKVKVYIHLQRQI